MNTALFLSIWTLFGTPLGPTTPVQRAAIARPAVQVSTARVATTRAAPTTAVRAPVTRPTVRVQPALRRVRPIPLRTRPTVFTPSTPAEPTGTGRFHCAVTENGATGAASYTVRKGSTTVLSGACLSPAAALPAGDYDVEVRLNGTVDANVRTFRVAVRDGRTATVRAEFDTARLTVTLLRDGRRIPGRATLRKNGRTVGTLGSGVYGVVSAGTYEVEVQVTGYDGIHVTRTLPLTLAPGQVRALDVPL